MLSLSMLLSSQIIPMRILPRIKAFRSLQVAPTAQAAQARMPRVSGSLLPPKDTLWLLVSQAVMFGDTMTYDYWVYGSFLKVSI